ncbi:MAG TPA: condensation domain-containing protein, partial [Pyrinomonadaceae bacterium]
KLRGYRIELGEIETALLSHELVRAAAVVVREETLVAYLVPAEQAPSTAELRDYLKQRLPQYMAPSAFVMLEQLPLSANGKLDKRLLPAPDMQAETDVHFEAPRTPIEEILAGIWTRVLGIERVGIFDNFFELGGHSLLATQVLSGIKDAFQIEISVRALFEEPTVAALAREIEQQRPNLKQKQLPRIISISRNGHIPLSFEQKRLWFLEQLEPGTPLYNCPGAAKLQGTLNVPALESALNEIIQRHESLRTTFATAGGGPVQLVNPASRLRLEVEDISTLSATEVARFVDQEAQTGFDLVHGPLLRVRLLRLAPQEHLLLFTMHHIISDAGSIGIFLQELARLYAAGCRNLDAALPELRCQYADYALWQHHYLTEEMLNEQLEYWSSQMAGAPPVLELPFARPRPAEQRHRGSQEVVQLSTALSAGLRALSRHERVTLYMTLLAAFDVLLFYYTNQTDIVVGANVSNRNRSETEQLIGFFLNQVPMRADLAGDPTFQELLQQVRGVALNAYTHQDIPFDRLVEGLKLPRNLNHAPLFQVKLDLITTPAPDLSETELRITPHLANNGGSHLDLIISLVDSQSELSGWVLYNTDLFDRTAAVKIFEQYELLLAQIVAHPEAKLSLLLAYLTEADVQQTRNKQDQFRQDKAARLKNLKRTSSRGSK